MDHYRPIWSLDYQNGLLPNILETGNNEITTESGLLGRNSLVRALFFRELDVRNKN